MKKFQQEGPLKARRPTHRELGVAYRYPRTTCLLITGISLTVLFSRPLYDIFFREQISMDYSEPPTLKKSLI